eukprot:Filipodium_phascolosomae@DN4543_c0_g1_i1.p1
MCDLTLVARVTDGLVFVETWDELGPEMQRLKGQAKLILKKLDRAPLRMSIDSGGNFIFHYIIENGVAFLTLCPLAYPKKIGIFIFGGNPSTIPRRTTTGIRTWHLRLSPAYRDHRKTLLLYKIRSNHPKEEG